MASGGKRGAGDRVLESKHVIGLFLLMLLFSGVFFSLGYVMGRNQYDGQVRAAGSAANRAEPVMMARSDPGTKKLNQPSMPESESESDAAPASSSGWEFSGTSKPAKSEPRLESVPKSPVTPPASKTVSTKAKPEAPPPPPPVKTNKSVYSAPAIPKGAVVLQVAAFLRQDDALDVASSLQKKHFASYVQPPHRDKYYRVQVGPFQDQKAADAAKKGLESQGFKAFYVKH
jgi:cell division septation protein DedD